MNDAQVENKTERKHVQVPETGLLTRSEAAAFLRISVDAVHHLSHRKVDPLPHLQAGRRHLFDRNELLKWATREARRGRQG
jgi:hypothetical protein